MGVSRWLTVALCAVLAGRCAAQCPNQCSGHGSCGAGNACTCDAQYAFAADCSLMSCPKGTAWADKASAANTGHSMQECSNQGLCVRATGACACNPGQGFRRYQSAFADTRRRRRRRPTYQTAAFYYCHTDASFSDSRRRGVLGISFRRRRNSRRRGKFTNVNTRRLEEEEGTFDELDEQAKTSM